MLFPVRSRLLALLTACLPLVAACDGQAGELRPAADDTRSEPVARVTSDALAPDSVDVTVAGRVIDDETGEGLAGGYVIVLAPGVSFDDWERSPAEDVEGLMAGAAVTDSLGMYEVGDLPRGLDFTVVVAAPDHAPAVFESGLTVRPDDPPLTRLADVRLESR